MASWTRQTSRLWRLILDPLRDNERSEFRLTSEQVSCRKFSLDYFKIRFGQDGGLHSTEVAYLLLTQLPRVWFPALPIFFDWLPLPRQKIFGQKSSWMRLCLKIPLLLAWFFKSMSREGMGIVCIKSSSHLGFPHTAVVIYLRAFPRGTTDIMSGW